MKCPYPAVARWFFLTWACLCLATAAWAQKVSEVKWKTPDGRQMQGLFVFTNEEKAYLRVSFHENGERHIVQVNYVIHAGKQWEDNYCWMDGRDPEWVTPDPGYRYSPDYFVWLWREPATDYGLPYTHNVPSQLGPIPSMRVQSYKDVNPKEVDVAYLAQFFLPAEPKFEAMRQLLGLVDKPGDDVVSGAPKVCTLHLIMVANTAIGDIGGSCEIDKRNMLNELEGVCEVTQMRLKRTVLDGNDFSKEKLTKALEDLQPEPNDVVVFVYRGHGFRWSDQTAQYPQLDLRYTAFSKISPHTSISLEEVYDIVSGKGARLNLFFADCCNSDVGLSRMTTANFIAMQSNQVNFNEEKLRRLFVEARGGLISAASSPGEVSWANNANGGFYTVSLLQSLREEISYMGEGDADWTDLLNNTVKGARYKSSRHMCGDCSEQNGIFKADIQYGN